MFTCQSCGATANKSSRLCKPAVGELESKFCGAPAKEVCKDQRKAMKYTCAACGSVSADAEHLCNPSPINK